MVLRNDQMQTTLNKMYKTDNEQNRGEKKTKNKQLIVPFKNLLKTDEL